MAPAPKADAPSAESVRIPHAPAFAASRVATSRAAPSRGPTCNSASRAVPTCYRRCVISCSGRLSRETTRSAASIRAHAAAVARQRSAADLRFSTRRAFGLAPCRILRPEASRTPHALLTHALITHSSHSSRTPHALIAHSSRRSQVALRAVRGARLGEEGRHDRTTTPAADAAGVAWAHFRSV